MYKKVFHRQPTFPSTNLILFVSQKLLLTTKLNMMTVILKTPGFNIVRDNDPSNI